MKVGAIMKKYKLIIIISIIIIISLGLFIIIPIYKDYSNNKRYNQIKEDIQEDIASYLRITNPYCTKGAATKTITDETLIYQRGMDKEKLLDIDKKSYCKVRIEIKCVEENKLDWDTYLSCKDYEDINYSNWETRKN